MNQRKKEKGGRLSLSFKANLFIVLFSVLSAVSWLFLAFPPDAGSGSPAEGARRTVLIAAAVLLSVTILGMIRFLYVPIRRLEALIAANQKERVKTGLGCFFSRKQPLDQAVEQILIQQERTLKREHKAELLRKDTELSALINQINPHFLYNTLDSIRGYAVLHNIGEIADLTESLSSLFRNVITKTDECIPLKNELNNIACYIRIQAFRFNNKVTLVQQIETADLLNHTVLNLTLQPIVENAFSHGLENKVGKGRIAITAYSTEKRLILTVSDNGVGMEPEKVKELNDTFASGLMPLPRTHSDHTGIALVNVNKRIQLHFGENYGLKILSTVGVGTDVEIVLPLLAGELKNGSGSFASEDEKNE